MVLSQKRKPPLGSPQSLQDSGPPPNLNLLLVNPCYGQELLLLHQLRGLHHWGFHPFAVMLAALVWAHPPGNLPRLIKFSQPR